MDLPSILNGVYDNIYREILFHVFSRIHITSSLLNLSKQTLTSRQKPLFYFFEICMMLLMANHYVLCGELTNKNRQVLAHSAAMKK